ncbi:MAG: diguanylate cyclase [Methylophaga sp.]|nr:MAG: diguanylate cyclase [Methylophaga sp.]
MPKDVDAVQAQLDSFIRIAKNNERKQANFQEYELSLLNSPSLQNLFSLILTQHKDKFQLSEVTLLLLDPEYEFQRLLSDQIEAKNWENRLLFTDTEKLISQYFSLQRKPRLSAFSPHQHQQLFPDNSSLRSVAILPLVRQKKLIGCLNLGSRKLDRFQANIGTQFLQHLAAVMSACIENARLQENIKQVGLRDPLTGVNNRRFFDQRIEEEVDRAQRNTTPLSCLFLDLDYFKRINDTHGHQAGDNVLKQVAHIFNETMRTSDVLARYGGEEFVILLADTPPEVAMDIAERIRSNIENTPFQATPSIILNITISIGLATMQNNPKITSSKQLVNAADQAVYAAKMAGRNRVTQAKK